MWRMPKMLQIRNVPDDLHREARSRAARAGMNLSDYLLRVIRQTLEASDVDELLERIRERDRIDIPESAAELIRTERDSP